MKEKPMLLVFLLVLIIAGAGLVLFWYGLGEVPTNTTDPEGTPEADTTMEAPEYTATTRDAQYTDGVIGFYAEPEEPGEYPGVVMIHEWWGLNDNIKQMAEELAGEGYKVLAVDLYQGEVAETPDRARELVGSLNQQAAVKNLQDAVQYLENESADKVASLGWCFGGGQSMQLALNQQDLDATVIYYGTLVTDPSALQNIDWPVLGVFGEEDGSIPVEQVRTFEEALDSLSIPHEIYVYPGVGHAFANPSGDNYAPEETEDAWAKTLRFLEDALKS